MVFYSSRFRQEQQSVIIRTVSASLGCPLHESTVTTCDVHSFCRAHPGPQTGGKLDQVHAYRVYQRVVGDNELVIMTITAARPERAVIQIQ